MMCRFSTKLNLYISNFQRNSSHYQAYQNITGKIQKRWWNHGTATLYNNGHAENKIQFVDAGLYSVDHQQWWNCRVNKVVIVQERIDQFINIVVFDKIRRSIYVLGGCEFRYNHFFSGVCQNIA